MFLWSKGLTLLFVYVHASHSSLQFFSHVVMRVCLPGLRGKDDNLNYIY